MHPLPEPKNKNISGTGQGKDPSPKKQTGKEPPKNQQNPHINRSSGLGKPGNIIGTQVRSQLAETSSDTDTSESELLWTIDYSQRCFISVCKSMPVFNNLLNLSIESHKEKGWQVMPLLLKSCPNLQTLLIKGLVHRVTNRCGDACACIPKNPWQKKKKRKIVKKKKKKQVCPLLTCQVKVREISEYGGSFQELQQMRHFLGNLACLETVKVGVDTDNDSKFVRANLKALPRLSSKCFIQFI